MRIEKLSDLIKVYGANTTFEELKNLLQGLK